MLILLSKLSVWFVESRNTICTALTCCNTICDSCSVSACFTVVSRHRWCTCNTICDSCSVSACFTVVSRHRWCTCITYWATGCWVTTTTRCTRTSRTSADHSIRALQSPSSQTSLSEAKYSAVWITSREFRFISTHFFLCRFWVSCHRR